MGDSASFWDKRADKYAEQPIKDVANYEKTLERTRAYLKPTDRVLEIGCGTGSTALLLAPNVGSILGTDIAPRMAEIGQEKAKRAEVDNARFECATADDLDPAEERFDVVLAFNLLHLLPDIPQVLGRVHALLEPGGTFISKSVCLAEKTRLWGWAIAIMKPLGLAPHVTMLTVEKLEGLIRDAGFEIVETGDYPPRFPSRFVVAKKV